jgi:hypothetical protein
MKTTIPSLWGASPEFVRRGIAAIQETQRTGTGIPADVAVAKLEAQTARCKAGQSATR